MKLNLEWVSFVSPSYLYFVSLYARTGVISSGENEICFPSATEIGVFVLCEKY